MISNLWTKYNLICTNTNYLWRKMLFKNLFILVIQVENFVQENYLNAWKFLKYLESIKNSCEFDLKIAINVE